MSIVDMILVIIIGVSLYTDLVERKIYNKVTLPAIAAGVVLNSAVNGTSGLKLSLCGLVVGMAVFFLPYLTGGIAAGDVKLMAAVGALKGPTFVFYSALAAGLAGGVMALMFVLYRGKLLNTLRGIVNNIVVAGLGGLPHKTTIDDGGDWVEGIPYGAAIFLGVIFTLMTGWNRWVI